MKKTVYLAGALMLAASAAPALAAFTATTTTDTVLTPPGAQPGPQPGDTFDTQTSGGFATYTATPEAPQLTGADLPYYRYTLDGAVNTVDTTTGQVDYTGTYRIFYDLNLDGLYDGSDPSVSSGNFNILATFLPATNDANLTGTLTQTAGPNNPAFRDLTEGGNSVSYVGTYLGNDAGVSGTIQGTLAQTAVPEPMSMALLGLGGIAMLGRRRRS